MKTRLAKAIETITAMRDQASDDEFTDELENALIHLESASDRLVAMDEEEDEPDPLRGEDEACDIIRDNQLTG